MDTPALKKIVYSGALAFLFIASEVNFLYETATVKVWAWVARDWHIANIAFAVIGMWIIEKQRVSTKLQESFLNGTKLLLCFVFLDILLTNAGLVKNPYYNLFVFMTGSGLAILFYLTETIKRCGVKYLTLALIGFTLSLYLLRVFAVYIISEHP